jgi:hypothetical protein
MNGISTKAETYRDPGNCLPPPDSIRSGTTRRVLGGPEQEPEQVEGSRGTCASASPKEPSREVVSWGAGRVFGNRPT